MLKQIIMMNGYTATGKSTTAKKIEKNISKTLIIHTAVIRKQLGLDQKKNGKDIYKFELDDPEFIRISKIVYDKIFKKMIIESKNYETIILDGTYNFLWQRLPIYEFSNKKNVHLVILNCVCENNVEIQSRLEGRKKNDTNPLSEASEYGTYLSTKKLSDNIFEDRFELKYGPHIIVYDTDNSSVRITQQNCEKCQKLSELLL